jgi:hypothetical protein
MEIASPRPSGLAKRDAPSFLEAAVVKSDGIAYSGPGTD